MTIDDGQRAGFISIIGLPNAGKSTLMNALIGMKIAITSKKVQTTRTRMLGILNHGASQLIFVDTPGVFQPSKPLERAMVETAWDALSESDIHLHLIDASQKDVVKKSEFIQKRLDEKAHNILVLNKIDMIKRDTLLALSAELNKGGHYQATFMISGLKEDGLEALKDYLASAVPAGPWAYEEDEITTMPMRMIAAEMTREKVFRQLHEEIPYDIYVYTENWEEAENGTVHIQQVITVTKDSQKAIVLGKRGARIKAIGTHAREDLEEFLDCKVNLKLFVRVEKNWAEKGDVYELIGLAKPF